jgi:hypothetical protein
MRFETTRVETEECREGERGREEENRRRKRRRYPCCIAKVAHMCCILSVGAKIFHLIAQWRCVPCPKAKKEGVCVATLWPSPRGNKLFFFFFACIFPRPSRKNKNGEIEKAEKRLWEKDGGSWRGLEWSNELAEIERTNKVESFASR